MARGQRHAAGAGAAGQRMQLGIEAAQRGQGVGQELAGVFVEAVGCQGGLVCHGGISGVAWPGEIGRSDAYTLGPRAAGIAPRNRWPRNFDRYRFIGNATPRRNRPLPTRAGAIDLDVEDLLGKAFNPAFRFILLGLCGLCLIIDGFDAQAMGYVAPSLLADWNVPKTALGPVFSSSLVGMLVGSLCLSILADRIGRRPVLIGATLFFAIAMLVTPLTSDIMLQTGGVIGTLLLGRFIERFGFVRVLSVCFALAALSIGLIGTVVHSSAG
jgi:hypothetical protein